VVVCKEALNSIYKILIAIAGQDKGEPKHHGTKCENPCIGGAFRGL
jgi:hypothetical protein